MCHGTIGNQYWVDVKAAEELRKREKEAAEALRRAKEAEAAKRQAEEWKRSEPERLAASARLESERLKHERTLAAKGFLWYLHGLWAVPVGVFIGAIVGGLTGDFVGAIVPSFTAHQIEPIGGYIGICRGF